MVLYMIKRKGVKQMVMVSGGFNREETKKRATVKHDHDKCPDCGSSSIQKIGHDRCYCKVCKTTGPNDHFKHPSHEIW